MKIVDNVFGFMWRSRSANNCNTYLFNLDGSKRILIDPGHRQFFQQIEMELQSLNLTVADIDIVVATHGHPDHIEAVDQLKRAGAKFALSDAEWAIAREFAPAMGVRLEDYQPDFFLQEGELCLDDVRLQIMHTPGHSPGSICIFWPEKGVLVTGDLVFNAGVGRTDLPGGNSDLLKTSVEKVSRIPAEIVLPGHGDWVSGAQAVQTNFKRINQLYFDYL